MACDPNLTLLALPREIRNQIIGEVFFPGEKEPDDLSQDIYGLARTAVRQFHPYARDRNARPKVDIAMLLTCKQLQAEGEEILYGTSSFNLMYDDWNSFFGLSLSYQFLEQLPRRLRRLVRRVERKCYSEPYRLSISHFEWRAFMKFLAEQCPNLQSLVLWGPGDWNEGLIWVEQCGFDYKWVQAILQIKTLKHFDIPVIQGGVIYQDQHFVERFLPALKQLLERGSRELLIQHLPQNGDKQPFPFLRLPPEIRRIIYRKVVLSDDRNVYVDMKGWYNTHARDGLQIMLSCRQLHNEVKPILYGESRFREGLHIRDPIELELCQKCNNPLNHNHAEVVAAQKRQLNNLSAFIDRYSGYIQHIGLDLCLGWSSESGESATLLPNSLLWNIQLQSLVITVSGLDIEMIQDRFEEFLRINPSYLLVAYAGTVTESMRRQWLILNALTSQAAPFDHWTHQLLRLTARTPNVEIRSVDRPDLAMTGDVVCWITKDLRQEFLKGQTDIPDFEWLYKDPRTVSM